MVLLIIPIVRTIDNSEYARSDDTALLNAPAL